MLTFNVISESTTTSLSESIFNYRREHGRTYHGTHAPQSYRVLGLADTREAYKDGKYIFPNDEVIQNETTTPLLRGIGSLTMRSEKQIGLIYSTTSSVSHLATASSLHRYIIPSDASISALEPGFGRWNLRTTSRSAR